MSRSGSCLSVWIPAPGKDANTTTTPLRSARSTPPNSIPANGAARAKLWGAKEILLVAKHTGGFCWWQTETHENTVSRRRPGKRGKGDLLAELSASCRAEGLHLGVYVYPGDDTWGAPSGSGGRTKDPSKQPAYNQVFRQQLTEVLTRYGTIARKSGSTGVALSMSVTYSSNTPPNAVIFQGPQATVRWAGTENGKLPYPAWNSLKRQDLKTGVSTAAQKQS